MVFLNQNSSPYGQKKGGVMIPHVNLSSFAGGGKTTISKLLLEKYRTIVIPKITTRPRRNVEVDIPEYIHVSQEDFEVRREHGDFIAVSPSLVDGEVYHHAITRPEFWPIISDETELILSAFGTKARLVQQYVPDLKLVFISFKDETILRERLRQRCSLDGSNFTEKWTKNEQYFAVDIESQYDFIVYNDTTPEECVSQIAQLVKIADRVLSE